MLERIYFYFLAFIYLFLFICRCPVVRWNVFIFILLIYFSADALLYLERVDIFRFKNVVIDGVARFYLVPHTKS
jgi:hypothetical protein